MSNSEKTITFKKILLIPVNTIKESIKIKQTYHNFFEAEKIANKLCYEFSEEGREQSSIQSAKNFEKLTTQKEKILYFYRHFNSFGLAEERSVSSAYFMAYLSENSKLFDKERPLALAPFFIKPREKALPELFSMHGIAFDENCARPYEFLLEPSDDEFRSDIYKLQCFIIASHYSDKNNSTWPYVLDLLKDVQETEKI